LIGRAWSEHCDLGNQTEKQSCEEAQILNNESDDPVYIPYSELAPDVLQRLIESFVLREGTDYGERPFTLVEKVAHVIGELQHGKALISFDPSTASITIRRAD
jgi:uncharacterized protein